MRLLGGLTDSSDGLKVSYHRFSRSFLCGFAWSGGTQNYGKRKKNGVLSCIEARTAPSVCDFLTTFLHGTGFLVKCILKRQARKNNRFTNIYSLSLALLFLSSFGSLTTLNQCEMFPTNKTYKTKIYPRITLQYIPFNGSEVTSCRS